MTSISTTARGILLDIEGTTSSVRFVFDIMFPYVRQHLATFLQAHRSTPAVSAIEPTIIDEARRTGWSGADSDLAGAVIHLMDRDAKTTGVKQLQGLIWANGFHSGKLVAHVYEEVPDCLRAWKLSGRDIRIYSSGSVAAQKLFFGHSIAGNLLPLFTEHYDTAVGGKREPSSYLKIKESFGMPAGDILFISDIVEELDAAASAGMQCVLSKRPENAPIADAHGFSEIQSFREIELVG